LPFTSDIDKMTENKEKPKPKKIEPKPVGKESGMVTITNKDDRKKK